MVTQRGATSGERAQQVHGGGPKATHSILVTQWCEPGVLRLLVIAAPSVEASAERAAERTTFPLWVNIL